MKIISFEKGSETANVISRFIPVVNIYYNIEREA